MVASRHFEHDDGGLGETDESRRKADELHRGIDAPGRIR